MRKIILILLLFLHMTTQGQTIEQTISHIRNAVFTVYAEDNNGKPFAYHQRESVLPISMFLKVQVADI